MERAKLTIGCVSLLGLLLGCGGTTNRDRISGAAGDGDAGGTSNTSGSGSMSGATNQGGTGGVAPLMTVDSFDTPEVFVSIGLWMEFPGDQLPIALPPNPHDGSALHLVGTTGDAGLDVFFHVATPVEKVWSGVRFWTQSDVANSFLTVAVAGPEPSYFKDRAQGQAWPQRLVALSRDWQEVVVDFADLGVDGDHVSPHEEQFGAFHFIIEPDTKYDLWIDDFAGQPRY